MSDNIHDLGNNDSDKESNNLNQDRTQIFFKTQYKGDPRKQPLFNYLKEVVCPFFSFKSFSFAILIINFLVFIASLFPKGLDAGKKNIQFLPPDTETLKLFGSLIGTRIRENFLESYRWVTNSVLHASFDHIFSNSLAILYFGTLIEYLIGTLKYALIYELSGILGSLFSVLKDHTSSSVGASICCFGIMGTLIAFYVINWNALSKIFGVTNKYLIIMFPLMMIILSFFVVIQGSGVAVSTQDSINQSQINIYGHLGGLVFGFFLALIFIKPKEESDTCCLSPKIWFIIGIVVCVLFAVAGFTCFYILDYYKSSSI